MLEHLIRQFSHPAQRQGPVRQQIVGKDANPSDADVDTKPERPSQGSSHALSLYASRVAPAEGDFLGLADADDVVAFGVGGVERFRRGVDGIAQDLDDVGWALVC